MMIQNTFKIIIFCTFLSTVEKVSNEWVPRLSHARCSGAGVINESNDLDPAAASRTVVASLHTHTRSQAPAILATATATLVAVLHLGFFVYFFVLKKSFTHWCVNALCNLVQFC